MNLQKCLPTQENSLGREAGGEGVSNINIAELLPSPLAGKLEGLPGLVAQMLARPLATAALQDIPHKQRSGQHTLARQLVSREGTLIVFFCLIFILCLLIGRHAESKR
jgi:hypothetical protein